MKNCNIYVYKNAHWFFYFWLAASCVQSRHFFPSTLREQLFELKNQESIKKSENLRDTCAC